MGAFFALPSFDKEWYDMVFEKATEGGYSLYKSIGFADSVSKYHQMEWHNESVEKNIL